MRKPLTILGTTFLTLSLALGTAACSSNKSQSPISSASSTPAQSQSPHGTRGDKDKKTTRADSDNIATDSSIESSSTLDDIVKDARQQIPEAMKNSGHADTFSSVTVDPVGNSGIEITYTFSSDKSAHALRTRAKDPAERDTLEKKTFSTHHQMLKELKQRHIKNPFVTFTYKDPEGSIVWTKTTHESDIPDAQ